MFQYGSFTWKGNYNYNFTYVFHVKYNFSITLFLSLKHNLLVWVTFDVFTLTGWSSQKMTELECNN